MTLREWLERRKTEAEISASLPEALDLWVLVMQAGLDMQVALRHYLDRAPRNALWREWSRVDADIQTGMPRTEALRALAARSANAELSDVARTLVQGLELGSSLTPLLRAQAQMLRKRRAYAAEKKAAVAPLKLLFPLLVFIFPTILVILFAPLVLHMKGQSLFP